MRAATSPRFDIGSSRGAAQGDVVEVAAAYPPGPARSSFRGSRREQEDRIDARLLGLRGKKLLALLGRVVDPITPSDGRGFRGGNEFREPTSPRSGWRAHQHDRGASSLFRKSSPSRERSKGRPMLSPRPRRRAGSRAVGHRVRERHAELEDVGARLDQAAHQRHGTRRCGSPAVMYGMSALRFALARASKRPWMRDIKLLPRALGDGVLSLSPRPER